MPMAARAGQEVGQSTGRGSAEPGGGWELPRLGWPGRMQHPGHTVRGERCQGGDVPREVAATAHGAQVPPLAG